MLVTERIKAIREEKGLSQGDIQERTGLLRCYVSRVENGHTVPSVETLQKFAKALGVETHQLFIGIDKAPGMDVLPKRNIKRISLRDQRQINEAAKLFAAIKSPRHRNIARLFLRQLGKVAVIVLMLTGLSTIRTNAQQIECRPLDKGQNNYIERNEYVKDGEACHEVRAFAKSPNASVPVKPQDSRPRLFIEGGNEKDREQIFKSCSNVVITDKHNEADYVLRVDREGHRFGPGEKESLWLFNSKGDLQWTKRGTSMKDLKAVCGRM